MEVKASLNNLRISPRKVRLVAGLLKGLDYEVAKSQLSFTVKRSAKPISKLLDSAAANAENNLNLVRSNLFIKNVIVDEGRKLKRYRAKGFGRTMMIQKKTSHVKIVLDEKMTGLKREISKKQEIKDVARRSVGLGKSEDKTTEQDIKKAVPTSEEKEKEPTKREYKPEPKQKPKGGVFGNIKKKFFRRKSI